MDEHEIRVPVVPYLPSQRWMSAWLQARLDGDNAAEAAVRASHLIDRREFGRTTILSHDREQLLTIPVAGGASVWKQRRLPPVEISQHGNWQHTHLGAIEAAYARTPYFDTLYSALCPLYNKAEGRLAAFNAAVMTVITSFLNIEPMLAEIKRRLNASDRILDAWSDVYREKRMDQISILDPLMRYGPDTLYLLLKN